MITQLRFLLCLAIAALTMSCADDGADSRPGLANDDFVPGTLIPSEDFRIENITCTQRSSSAKVDGESVPEEQWVVNGTLVNLLDTGSPNYHLDVRATLSDGSIFERDGRSFFPLAAGESGDFSILVAGQLMFDDPTLTVVDCDVVVLDSVLNYAR